MLTIYQKYDIEILVYISIRYQKYVKNMFRTFDMATIYRTRSRDIIRNLFYILIIYQKYVINIP